MGTISSTMISSRPASTTVISTGWIAVERCKTSQASKATLTLCPPALVHCACLPSIDRTRILVTYRLPPISGIGSVLIPEIRSTVSWACYSSNHAVGSFQIMVLRRETCTFRSPRRISQPLGHLTYLVLHSAVKPKTLISLHMCRTGQRTSTSRNTQHWGSESETSIATTRVLEVLQASNISPAARSG